MIRTEGQQAFDSPVELRKRPACLLPIGTAHPAFLGGCQLNQPSVHGLEEQAEEGKSTVGISVQPLQGLENLP